MLTQSLLGLIESDNIRNIIYGCIIDQISPQIAVMQLLLQTKNVEITEEIVQNLCTSYQRFVEMKQLVYDNRENCTRIVSMLSSGLDKSPQVNEIEQRITFYSQIFNQAVNQSAEASVALYSLGNPKLLQQATQEVIDLLDIWSLLDEDQCILQIGCGIGRFEATLAKRVKAAYGIDISANMIKVACDQCKEFDNVHFSTCSGQDLSLFRNNMLDLVYAVDSFPYIYEAGGMTLIDRHFAEVARVLKEKGDFVILNFSYRDNIEADQCDITRLAQKHNFTIRINGTQPFTLWDGKVWWLERNY